MRHPMLLDLAWPSLSMTFSDGLRHYSSPYSIQNGANATILMRYEKIQREQSFWVGP